MYGRKKWRTSGIIPGFVKLSSSGRTLEVTDIVEEPVHGSWHDEKSQTFDIRYWLINETRGSLYDNTRAL
jgi:hypothetical protein